MRWHLDTGNDDTSWGRFTIKNNGPLDITSVYELDSGVLDTEEVTEVYGSTILAGYEVEVEFQATVPDVDFEGAELYVTAEIGGDLETKSAIWPAATE